MNQILVGKILYAYMLQNYVVEEKNRENCLRIMGEGLLTQAYQQPFTMNIHILIMVCVL